MILRFAVSNACCDAPTICNTCENSSRVTNRSESSAADTPRVVAISTILHPVWPVERVGQGTSQGTGRADAARMVGVVAGYGQSGRTRQGSSVMAGARLGSSV